jgi:hypothetical protein
MSVEGRAEAGQDSSPAFSVSIILGLVVVGVLSFAAFIVLSAFADDLRKPEDGGTHALSKSAVGFAGIVSLLQGDGRAIRLSRGSLGETSGSTEMGVLTPDVGQIVSAEDVAGAWGGVLIVLPKWDAWPDDEHPGWVRSDGLANSADVERVLQALDKGFIVGQAPGASDVTLKVEDGVGGDIAAGRIERLQTMVSIDIEPILTDGNDRMVLGVLRPDYGVDPATLEEGPAPEQETVDEAEEFRSVEENTGEASPEDSEWVDPEGYDYGRRIFVLSEPDLLNTKGLASVATANAGLRVIEMIAPDKQPVIFDMTLHGMERSRSFMKLLLEPPFLPAVLCLAFAGGLMAVNAIAGQMRMRSGREIALGKATLVENSALLVSMVGRDVHMGRRYAAMTRLLAATAAGAPVRSSEAQQTAMLDAASRGAHETRFSELAAEVAAAQTPSALASAANKLFRWRQEIGREHRRR